jgi:hypothetical protein
MSNNKDYYHDKGEQDRAKGPGNYNPPHGIIDDLSTWTDSGMKKNREENQAYRQGWTNTDEQVKK